MHDRQAGRAPRAWAIALLCCLGLAALGARPIEAAEVERAVPAPSSSAGAEPASPSPGYPPGAYPQNGYPGYPPPGYPAYPAYPPYQQPGGVPPVLRATRAQRLPYQEGDVVPPGYHPVHRTRLGFVIPGVLMISLPYLGGGMVATALDYKYGSGWLMVPVLGPWLTLLAMPKNHCDDTQDFCDGEEFLRAYVRFYLALDGVVQGAGLVLTIIGAKGTTYLVRDGYALTVTPGRVGTGYGAVLTGWTF